mmetsp:Transcript_30701/g.95022  ORF Transcript_30701/g.95022 Transcript_30701/m.95022 type:complete len:195 (+) Transcript_30701:436-1020(+)
MGLLFGGSSKEVPFRRKVVLMLVYAAMKVGSFFIVSPLFKGEHCSALPSARAYLIVFAILCIATVPSQLFTNAIRLNKDLLPHMDSNVRADEGELYQGQKTVSSIEKLLGLATLLVGICWGLTLWSVQTRRGGSNSNCDSGIYSAIGVSAWICVAIFLAILVYGVLVVLGIVSLPKKDNEPRLETPLDAEASAE